MLDFGILEQSPYFQKRTLKDGGVLFGEGDIDENIYIIASGEILVEKSLLGDKTQYKTLAFLKVNDIFGEGALNNNDPKQVQIRASGETTLLFINAKKGISEFVTHDSEKGIEFFKAIIALGNQRLLKSNQQITASYEMNQNIAGLEEINIKTICYLIEKFKKMSCCERVIFLEKNAVLEGYYTLKYDTHFSGKLGNAVIVAQTSDDILKQFKIIQQDFSFPHILLEKLNVGRGDIGYLIFGRENLAFEENDKKIISSIATSLAGVIQQEKVLEEQKNRDYLNN